MKMIEYKVYDQKSNPSFRKNVVGNGHKDQRVDQYL